MGTQHVQLGPAAGHDLHRGQAGHRLDERQLGRVHAARGSAHVEHAERPSRPRVGQRRRGAAPPGVRLHEVLRTLHPDALAEHQRRTDRVRADVSLGPGGAAHEPQVVGEAAYGVAALAPQDPAVGVGDDDQLPGVDHGPQRLGERGDHV